MAIWQTNDLISAARMNNLDISTIIVAGLSTFNGNVILGDATSDTVTITGRLASSFDPSADNVRSMGTASLRFSDIVSAQFRVFSALGDANPSVRLSANSIELGAGGATALDVQLTRDAANRLALASGDSLNIISGSLLFGGSLGIDSSRNATFVGLTTTGNTTLGDAAADTLTINATPQNNVGSFQRATGTGNVSSVSSTNITVTWPIAWGDTNYKFTIGWQDDGAGDVNTLVCAGVTARTSADITVQFRGGTVATGTDIRVFAFAWND